MGKLRKIIWVILIIIIILKFNGNTYAQVKCTEVYGAGPNRIVVATGSPGELGLLRALSEAFLKKNDVSICWIKAGSGEALKLLKNKVANLVLTHAPSYEVNIKRDGKFIIVPPKDTSAERLVKAVSEIKLVFSLERATKFS